MIEVPNNFYWQLFLPVIKLASLLPGLGCFIIGLVLWENTDISFLTLFPSYMDVLSLRLLLPLAFSKMDDKKSSHFEKDRGPQSISRVWAFCIKSEGKEDTYVESRMGSLWIRPQLLPRFCEPAKLLQLYHIACNRQATLSTGFSRQILQWVAMPSSKVSSWPRDWTCVSWGCCIVGGSLPLSHQGSPKQSSMALFSALPGLSYGPLEYVFNLKYLNHIMEIIWVILVFIYTINTG